MFPIERGIPLPAQREPPAEHLAPWNEFVPGDSVFLPLYANRALPGFKQFNITLLNKRFPNKKFICRRVVVSGIAGLRVWRSE